MLVAAIQLARQAAQPRLLGASKPSAMQRFAAAALIASATALAVATYLQEHGGSLPREAAVASAAASGILVVLMVFGRTISMQPSSAICVYLAVLVLCDMIQIRTSWLEGQWRFSTMLTARGASALWLLCLEAQNKQKGTAISDTSQINPETSSSVVSKSFFWWLNELIRRGYSKELSADDLYPLDEQLEAEKYQSRFFLAYKANNAKPGKTKSRPWALIRTLVATINTGLLSPVPARLALSAFSFAQPFFIKSMLDNLQASSTPSSSVSLTYVALIAFVNVGTAVSTGIYWYYHQRALVALRACLVTAIYRKTIRKKTYSSENFAAITLMNSEVNLVQTGVYCMHEFWASLVETAIASWLLQRQIGTAFAAPLLVVITCTALAFSVGHFASKRQGAWMDVLGRRVGLTSLVIPNLSAIKMSGMGSQIGRFIQLAREKEISVANRFRLLMVFSATISFVPIIMSPSIAFTVAGGSLTITKVFTSLAFINLICNPLVQVLQFAPSLLAAVTSLGRIQDYLDSDAHDEAAAMSGTYTDGDDEPFASESATESTDFLVTFEKAKLSWVSTKWTVEDISFEIAAGSQTLMAGPVGSGKTTACLGLLEETPYSEGTIHLKRGARVAYCSQDPFILNGTIQENIVGFSEVDTAWYNEVVECCQLLDDFKSLPQRDQTNVGSKGIALSGGQRKRICLARAAYSRPEIALLDDVFGGIDTHTAREIEQKVFSRNGLFRRMKTAVLLCSQSTHQASMFDEVVILRDGAAKWKGPPSALPSEYGIAQKSNSKGNDTNNDVEGVEDAPISARKVASPPHERVMRPPGGFANYQLYFGAIGQRMVIIFSVLVVVSAFLYSTSSLWLEQWIQHQDDKAKEAFYFRFYWGLQIASVIIISVYFSFYQTIMGPKASSRLHFGTLKSIIGAPLDYYTTVDSSVPTGYMSQDMSILDNQFTNSFANMCVTALSTSFQSVLISIATPLILAAYPVFGGILFVIQKIYLRTATQLRFLALETRDPLYKHFIETIDGLATLRAFGWADANIALNLRLLNKSQQSSYLVSLLHQWLSMMINLCVALVSAVLVALASQYPTSAGFVGVALVNLMSFGQSLGHLVRNYAELQTAAVALSRLRLLQEFVVGEDEQYGSEKIPSTAWPDHGTIQIHDVSAAYDVNRPYPGKQHLPSNVDSVALKNVSLDIKSGEHVLICGRTGSGKSTLLLLLQGFLGPKTGSVTIDSIEPCEIYRAALRDRLIALPQMPFFLPGEYTIRENLEYHTEDKSLDFGAATQAKFEKQDVDGEYALRAVGLWEIVSARGGLDTQLSDDSLSRGQKQLFSLARAILRQRLKVGATAAASTTGVLLLDEFNTGLDSDTEKRMWEVIKKEFAGVTIVCVAHRLGAAVDFDKAVVLSHGEIVEQGRPSALLADTNSKFHAIWTSGDR